MTHRGLWAIEWLEDSEDDEVMHGSEEWDQIEEMSDGDEDDRVDAQTILQLGDDEFIRAVPHWGNVVAKKNK